MGEVGSRLPSDRVNCIVPIGLLFGVVYVVAEKWNGRVGKRIGRLN
jgi:hypothetical protein